MNLENLDRRTVLALLAGGGSASLAGCTGEDSSTQTTSSVEATSPTTTPTTTPPPATPAKPEYPTVNEQTLVKECYGSLDLNEKQPFFPVKIPDDEGSGCYLLEYRLDRDGFGLNQAANLDLFLLDHSFQQYKDFVYPGKNCLGPILGFGPYCIDSQPPAFDDDWLAENYAATTLDDDSVYKRVLIPNDSYHLIIDATSAPDASERGKSTASATLDVSLRLTRYSYAEAEKLAIQTVGSLVNELPDEWQKTVSNLRTTAQEMCSTDAVETASEADIDEIAGETAKIEGITSAAADILSVLESRYSIALPDEPLKSISNAARWGGKHLPVIGSVIQVATSACGLASLPDDAKISELREKAKSLFVSITLLVADLVMSWWGVTSRVAYSLTSATDYLLGYLRQVVGLRFYVVILKNTLFLFETSISELVDAIYETSEEIAQNTNFISDRDLSTLLQLNGDNVSDWRQLGFLNADNECGAIISNDG